MLKRAYLGLVLVLCACSGLFAQALPTSPPEAVGLSSERLERLKTVVQQYTDAGRIAGVVTLVARGGRIAHLESFGKMDVERNLPMRKDTIFRIASMSKAVTSVAIVMLMEEGKLLLTDPVSKHVPAFKQTTVAVAAGGPPASRFGIIPAKREITIRDLLTHTAGISYGMGPAAEQWKAAGIQGWYLGDRKEPIAAIVDRIAALPFDAQPGEQYVYGYSADILGALVEKVSGMPLDQFLRARIFEPLKMVDSSFFLPVEKRGRLATVYSATPTGGITRAPDGGMGQGDYVDGPRACFSGGAGILSTPTDYARLLQMLLNGGELDGARLLSPKSVELMTVNHVGSLYDQAGGNGFGLGFEVTENVGRSGRPGSAGAWGWGSAYYSRYFVDPHEKLVAIIFSQLVPAGGLDLDAKFRVLVYQSIVGPVPPPSSTTAPRAPVKQKLP
jgi:CubicO group peptidase (beta-lactamase class C family)